MTKDRLKQRLKQKELLLVHYEKLLSDQGNEIADLHQLISQLILDNTTLKNATKP